MGVARELEVHPQPGRGARRPGLVGEQQPRRPRHRHPRRGCAGTLRRWRLLLLNNPNAAGRIRNELYASKKQHVRVGKEKPAHAAITYLYLRNQAPRMGYVAARAAGLPIGSGNVEVTCKSLIGQRLIRSGSRWKESTCQHVIDLSALALSGRFDAALDLTLAPLVRQVARAA